MLKLLNFSVAGMRFSADLESIIKVVPFVALTPVPKANACIAGVMDNAGKNVPVIDLSIRLGLAKTESYSLATSIIIFMCDGQMIGLIVDQIDEIDSIEKEAIELAEQIGLNDSTFLGVYRNGSDHQVLVLNIEQTLDLTHLISSPQDLEALEAFASDGTAK